MVTGCLKMEAVCLTGSDVFKSGLPCKISNTEGGEENKRSKVIDDEGLFHKTVH